MLLAAGAVGPILFVVVLLLEGATRPGYSAWRNYGSSLALSDQGWEQITNFLLCGALVICFAVGLRQVLQSGKASLWGPLLIGAFGLSLLVAGIFVTDPGLGYPPGSPIKGSVHTMHGMIHGLAGLAAFGTIAAAPLVMARRFAGNPNWKGWVPYSIASGLAIPLLFVAFTVTSVQDELGTMPNAPTGFLQRIAIILGWGWLAALAIRLLQGVPLGDRQDTGQRVSGS
jgi:hypothetical protein